MLPVDRQVRFDITSTNMMNTFYAPTMAGMIYAMPGMQSQLHAVLNRPGEYEGYSANYSGAGFSRHALPAARRRRRRLRALGRRRRRASGRALDLATYRELEKPSEKVPAMHFAAVRPRPVPPHPRALRRAGHAVHVARSWPTTRRGGGDPAMPPRARSSMPQHGDKPEGALFKAPEEKGAGATTTASAATSPSARDQAAPESAGPRHVRLRHADRTDAA